MRRLLTLFAALTLAACGASPAPVTTVTVTTEPSASASPSTPTAPKIGAWKASCSDPGGDAKALLANLTAQPQFAGGKASADPGWATALAAAVAPMRPCQTSHLLATVALIKDVGGDAAAGKALAAKVLGLAKGRAIQLSGTKIARLVIGTTTKAEAVPVLTAILGKPSKTDTWTCELSGESNEYLAWNGFQVEFNAKKAGKPLDSWNIRVANGYPKNLSLIDGLRFKTTFAALKAKQPSLTQNDMFGTDAGPWISEVRPGLTYLWDVKSGQSSGLNGGPLHGCE